MTNPPYLAIYMGCPKLLYLEENERPIFLAVWKKSAGDENCENYYPFGLTFNSYQRENALNNQYQYNGKEAQEELSLGWLDYGQRMYQPELGRFFSQDRFASKYFNTSPYSYGANNPALYVDINGDSVWTTHTSTTDSDGNTTVTHTINITGKVLKQSNGTATARGVAAGLNGRLNAQRNSTTKKNDDGTTTTEITKMNAQYTAASSMDDVSSSDHLVVITDGVLGDADPDLGGGSAAGIGAVGGQISYVEDAGAVETAFHEVGHNLGLDHPKFNSGDPMSYTGRGGNFSPAQMDQILNNSIYGVPNRGSNSTTMGASFSNTPQGKFYGTTDNTRPFSVAPGTRARIPLPLTSGYR